MGFPVYMQTSDIAPERFRWFIIILCKWLLCSLSSISKADQTPLTFNLLMVRIIARKEEKTVEIVMTSHEKDCFMVMLAVFRGKLLLYLQEDDTTQRSQVSGKGHCLSPSERLDEPGTR